MFKSAAEGDIQDISALHICFRLANGAPSAYENDHWIRTKLRSIYVLRDGPDLVGAFSLVSNGKEEARLLTLAICRRQRGKGLGREMVGHAIELAKGSGATTLHVLSGKRYNAAGFYERLGFDRDEKSSGTDNYAFKLRL